MSIELQSLLGLVGILLILVTIQGMLVPVVHGLKWGLGPRDKPKEPSVLQGRLKRIVANHMEGMAMFVPLILVAHLTAISTPLTVLGAGVFLAGRAAFAVVYFLGIPVLRSAVWGVSMAGLFMVAYELVKTGL